MRFRPSGLQPNLPALRFRRFQAGGNVRRACWPGVATERESGAEQMADARYDGLAEWYDDSLKQPLYDDVPGHVCRLAGSGNGLCIDAGCGTGTHLGLLASRGWTVVGADVSSDQLRLARRRWHALVQGDAGRMPFHDACASRVVSVLTLTDFDDVDPFFHEAKRILSPDGLLVVISVHPCFVGPFARMEGGPDGVAMVYPGYWITARVFQGPGIGPGVRSRVGVRHVPLSELLNKLLSSGLQSERVEELGEGTVPWLVAFRAKKP